MRDLIKAVQQHATMCADFERMGTGQFREKYPDYSLGREGGYGPEGVHYITRKAAELAKLARSVVHQPDSSS